MILQEGKTIRYLGHIWIVKGKSSLGPEYVALQRKSYLADLKREGQVATKIDVSFTDIKYNRCKEKVRKLEKKLEN